MSKIGISGEIWKSWKYSGMNFVETNVRRNECNDKYCVSSGIRKNIDTLRTKFGLQIYVNAENILNKQLQVPDK
jgi:hypothetical protein